jgi:hypothetical protein
MRRILLVLVFLATLAACSSDATPTITVVFNHSGEVIEPPLEGIKRVWTHKHALAVITKGQSDGRTRAWFGSYQGKPAWLAITDNASVAIPGPQKNGGKGYWFRVVADGVTPVKVISSQVYAYGKPPAVNVAPPRRAYNERLHVTFITPGVGATASLPTKWKMEPAPNGTMPRQSLAEAQLRSQSPTASVGTPHVRVYFGWFTGLDRAGALHANAPAWVVVATTTRRATAFADDLTQPWVSARVTLRPHTAVY